MKGDCDEETVKNAGCAFLLQTPEFENKVVAKKDCLKRGEIGQGEVVEVMFSVVKVKGW